MTKDQKIQLAVEVIGLVCIVGALVLMVALLPDILWQAVDGEITFQQAVLK